MGGNNVDGKFKVLLDGSLPPYRSYLSTISFMARDRDFNAVLDSRNFRIFKELRRRRLYLHA